MNETYEFCDRPNVPTHLSANDWPFFESLSIFSVAAPISLDTSARRSLRAWGSALRSRTRASALPSHDVTPSRSLANSARMDVALDSSRS